MATLFSIAHKDKRPNIRVRAVWQHQNRDDLNGAHMPFDLFFLFFFFAITHSLAFDAPCPRNNSGAVEMNAE